MKIREESVLYGVLDEELERNIKMQTRYKEEIEKMVKGSILLRNIKGHEYYYLKYRKNGKVVSKYLGKAGECDIVAIQKEIDQRKHLEAIIKRLKTEEKELRKMIL